MKDTTTLTEIVIYNARLNILTTALYAWEMLVRIEDGYVVIGEI